MHMKAPILDAIQQCKKSPPSLISADLVEGAFGFVGFMNHQELLDAFIARTHQHWELIAKTTDVAPVLESVLGGFEELGTERCGEILRVVKNDEVDKEVQKKLLDLGRSLVKIGIRHLQAVGSKEVDVKRMAQLYQLK
jgi:hypothetical protein